MLSIASPATDSLSPSSTATKPVAPQHSCILARRLPTPNSVGAYRYYFLDDTTPLA